MNDGASPLSGSQPDKSRAKLFTLVILVTWVIAVFVATMLKFAKVW